MTIDKLMNDASTWIEQALKRQIFDKVDGATLKFPEEMRERRIAELGSRIAELSRRKEEAVASYDRVIALEQSELDSLNQKPATPAPNPTRGPVNATKKTKSARKQKR
jgi:hypothetical protein